MKEPSVYILSDSSGETAELVMKAGLSQFTPNNHNVKRIPYVEDKHTIDDALAMMEGETAIIGYTLVNPELRSYLNEKASEMNIEVIDIMGPMMEVLERTFQQKPRLEPGLVYKLDKEYFRRIEAIEFAVRYDDGRDPRGIARADIVLIGVSRTSKTPLSQYLAHKRLKVANVPVVPEVNPPEELFRIDKSKCIGLRISPEKLNEIRKERLKALGLGDHATYATLNRIEEELRYFDKIVNKIGCDVIDVSNKAVEETANIILHKYRQEQEK